MTTSTIKRAYADTPRGQMHYRYAGDGPPLLLLHQTANSSGSYEPLMPFLAPKHRVLAVDTPGFGMSDWPARTDYTIADYAECFVAFMRSMGIERASIFAHHTGASFGCEIAAAHPEMVDRLILNGTPYWEDAVEEFLNHVQGLPVKEDGSHLMEAWDLISERLEPSFHKPLSKDMLEALSNEVLYKLMSGERFIEAYTAISYYDVMSRLPLIQAPTLVMSGEQDILRYTVEPVAAKIAGARQYVCPGGSYFMTYEDPEGLAQVILEFLDEADD